MDYLFLPPYSPDYNPIELAFSAVKAHIRRHGNDIRMAMEEDNDDDLDVVQFLHSAVFSVTSADCWSFFHHCGYV